jgi:cell fate regulator YaaT (PSP1 superfamily)
MGQVLGVKFRDWGQVYFFESGPFVVKMGDKVLVETEQGMGLGNVVAIREHEDFQPEESDAAEGESLKTIYRLAGPDDKEQAAENEMMASEAFAYCRERIAERKLDMKLVDVEVFFDRSKMVFYFTAPGRIDFRELVKDLVREYRTRIELRQIGVRHETQMIGAVGNCGQVCCCRRFLRKFEPVTIKMAKEQNLFLNPTKISGMCGRLLCCLGYEQENYVRFQKGCPKTGKRFQTSLGTVKVLRSNFFRDTISILTESGEEREIGTDEWKEILGKEPPEQAETPSERRKPKPQRPPRPPKKEQQAEEEPHEAAPQGEPDDPAQAEGEASASESGTNEKPKTEGENKARRPRGRRKPRSKASQAKSEEGGEGKPKKPRRRRRSRSRKPKQQSDSSGE